MIKTYMLIERMAIQDGQLYEIEGQKDMGSCNTQEH